MVLLRRRILLQWGQCLELNETTGIQDNLLISIPTSAEMIHIAELDGVAK